MARNGVPVGEDAGSTSALVVIPADGVEMICDVFKNTASGDLSGRIAIARLQ